MAAGICLFLAGLVIGSYPGVALILGFSLLFQLFRPLFQHHVQAAVKGNERATVASIPGLAGGALGALAYMIIGQISNYTSELVSIGLYAGVWLVIVFVYAWWGNSVKTTFSSSSNR